MPDYFLNISGKIINLSAPVKQKMKIGGLTIIRIYPNDDFLASYSQQDLNRNVYAYDSSGNFAWQIQEAPHGGDGEDKAYMNINFIDGRLIAGNWIGIDYCVDLESGNVSQVKKDARPW